MLALAKAKAIAVMMALLIGVGLLIYFFRKIRNYFRYRAKDLKALGIYHERKKRFIDPHTKTIREKVISSRLKIYQDKNNIVLAEYNPAMAVLDFERLKENLEHIWAKKIDHISARKPRLPWRQREIIFHIESFNRVLTMNDGPKNLERGQYWLAKTATAKDLVLDVMRGDFSLGIFALSGAGKGNAIFTVVSSFLEPWIRHTGDPFYRVLILDAKGTDFHALIKKYNAKSLNPIFLDELKEAVAILEAYKKEIDEYRKYLADSGITISHWLKLKNKYPDLKPIPQPFLIIADELSQYMTPRPSVRITKDSTDEQIKIAEQCRLEERLSALLNSILQLFRSSGVLVIVSNQTLKVEELTLQRTNIINFLLGRNSAQMSRLLVGDEKTLIDTTLKAGRFIFSGNGEVIKVQVPFVLTDDK
jgi:hypothetical protein